ncbi:hypothetical protein [Nocardioides cavernaquae]|uniref:Ig-like domain-containing protein n=1 Tax=Nocardioides cavernaquae TaxID=2321396 RepID=A0A3A5H7P0_9ACTN|nr:hypothetical protein [Nocardioides cavernaquae]RJS45415.1 hypothetical protein D4739_03725 [Nocardioides cavernaquae]
MKTLSAVITAFLVSAVLLVVSAPAHAAYPKSISSSCSATSSKLYIKPSTAPRVAFSATAAAGNGTPTGTVKVSYIRKSTGKVVKLYKRSYSGGVRVYTGPKLGRGSYVVKVVLMTPSTSVFKNCRDYARQIVRR